MKTTRTFALSAAALLGGSLLTTESARAFDGCGYGYRWSDFHSRCVSLAPVGRRPTIVVGVPGPVYPGYRPYPVYPGYRPHPVYHPYPGAYYPGHWGKGFNVIY